MPSLIKCLSLIAMPILLFYIFLSFIIRILMPTPQRLEEKQAYLMKKSKYFSYKQSSHTIYNYLSKRKIAIILKNINENKNSQKKE